MINFDKVERSVKTLKQQFTAGKVDKNTFEARLLDLVDFAADGYYWMFGHETEQWYQHNGQEWIQKDPGKLRLLTPRERGNHHTVDDNPGHQDEVSNDTSLSTAWRSVGWGWFVLSLALLVLIGWIIFASSLG